MYRKDQKSFMLYPARELPAFMEKNIVPEKKAAAIPLVKKLLDSGDSSIISRDAYGALRFSGDLSTSADVGAALDVLRSDERLAEDADRDRHRLTDLF